MLSCFWRLPLYRSLFIVAVTLLFFFGNLSIIYYFIEQPVISHNPEKVIQRVDDPYSCTVTDSLAKNALERVRTESCRLKLTEASCKLKNGIFHESFPASTCSNHDSLLVSLRVGCFNDSPKKRTLQDFTYEFKADNSPDKCKLHCYRAGFLYYGLEFGKECFCGDKVNATSLPDDKCREYVCPGDNTKYCGGFNAIEIYRTGLKQATTNPKTVYVNPDSLSQEERDNPVRILFLLQLNGRNDRQVKRLLKAIYSPRHLYYIHVDQRQLYMLTEMKTIAGKLPNVYVAPDGHSTIWGGASLLKMVIDAIRRSLTLSHMSNWDYLFNLSESDFPVLSLEELEAQLTKNRGKSFLASHGYNTARFIQKQGFDFVFQECDERMWRIGKRNDFPSNLRIDGGSDWVVIHRDFAEYSISDEELPRKMRSLFSSIILPVESFYHTLGHNSKFCNTIFSSHLRLTNWNRKQGCRCASLKKVVDWCGCSPLVFKKEHTSKFELDIVKQKSQYVARKFESLVDIEPVNMAEAQIRRNNPDLLFTTHPSFNSTFVNFYKADIDGYSQDYSLLAKSLMASSSLKNLTFSSLQRIDVFKQNSVKPMLMIFTINVAEQMNPVQLLLDTTRRSNIISPGIVNGFKLEDVEFGVGLDHKEEIFRMFARFVTLKGSPVVKLKWSRVPNMPTTVNVTKTSPNIKVAWRNPENKIIAEQTLLPYDSIYGSQFAQLDLEPLALQKIHSGVWTIIIQSKSILADVSFPVFDSDNPEQFKSMVNEFYVIIDACIETCESKLWSTFYPDPKSEILTGFDSVKKILR